MIGGGDVENQQNNLFNTDDNDVVMPSSDRIEDTSGLMSSDISPILTGNKVSRLLVPVDSSVDYPNYVIDLSDIKSITSFQKESLRSLCSELGDCSLYLYAANKLKKIGTGNKDSLEILLPIVRSDCFGSNIRIYRNFKLSDDELDEIKGMDVTRLSLNI